MCAPATSGVMSSHLTPLQVCETLIAPRSKLGVILGANEKAAYAWVKASIWRDAGDLPPRANRKALRYAKRHGIPLTPAHLIWGASRAEIDDLVQQMRAARVAAQ